MQDPQHIQFSNQIDAPIGMHSHNTFTCNVLLKTLDVDNNDVFARADGDLCNWWFYQLARGWVERIPPNDHPCWLRPWMQDPGRNDTRRAAPLERRTWLQKQKSVYVKQSSQNKCTLPQCPFLILLDANLSSKDVPLLHRWGHCFTPVKWPFELACNRFNGFELEYVKSGLIRLH